MYKNNILAWGFVVFLAPVCIWLSWLVTLHSVEKAFVLDYIKIFYEMEEKAMEGELTPEEAAAYVESYYPVGTKLKSNTELSEVVETIRNEVLERLNRIGARSNGAGVNNGPQEHPDGASHEMDGSRNNQSDGTKSSQ